mgnify:CR=1 FL=1
MVLLIFLLDIYNNNIFDNFILMLCTSIIFVIIFAICMYFECGYLRNAQKGMINIYNSTYEGNNTK